MNTAKSIIPKAVVHLAKKFNGINPDVSMMEYEDYLHAGYIGYLNSLRLYNGLSKFTTYSYLKIQWAILEEIWQFKDFDRTNNIRIKKKFSHYHENFGIEYDLDEHIELKELKLLLKALIETLDDKEKFVIKSLIYENKTGRWVAKKLKRDPARVCQIRDIIVKKLRKRAKLLCQLP